MQRPQYASEFYSHKKHRTLNKIDDCWRTASHADLHDFALTFLTSQMRGVPWWFVFQRGGALTFPIGCTRPSISSQCGLESYWMRTCLRNIFLRLFGTYLLEIDGFLGSKWVPESSCEVFFLKNCCHFQLVTSCKGASVQRLLCVKAFVCKSFCV